MIVPGALIPQRRTRIQTRKTELILEAALDVFSKHGFKGATVDAIARSAGMSKPNLLYYFPTKEAMYKAVFERTLRLLGAALGAVNAEGNAETELRDFVRRNLKIARDFPRESLLFCTNFLLDPSEFVNLDSSPISELIREQSAVFQKWADAGMIAKCDPHQIIFVIWTATQSVASTRTRELAGSDRGGTDSFEANAGFIEALIVRGMAPGMNTDSLECGLSGSVR